MQCISCKSKLNGLHKKFCSGKCKSKNYYRKNRVKCINSVKKYQANNREKVRERDKEYYYKNRERIIKRHVAYNLRWRHNNVKRNREYQNRYRLKNREKRVIYQQLWRRKNKEKKQAYERLREIAFRKIKEGKTCSCGNKEDIVFHHTSNQRGVFICKKCHKNIHSIKKKWITKDTHYYKLRRNAMKELRKKFLCTICKKKKRLIFHHTDYNNDKGIYVCEKCHKGIHYNLVQVDTNISNNLGWKNLPSDVLKG